MHIQAESLEQAIGPLEARYDVYGRWFVNVLQEHRRRVPFWSFMKKSDQERINRLWIAVESHDVPARNHDAGHRQDEHGSWVQSHAALPGGEERMANAEN